jgi:predicted ester cyclase
LTGAAIGDFAKSVFAAFPDMSLEVISIGDTGGGLVALQWVLRGTNTGKLGGGTPATGRRVTLPRASFVQVEGDKIRSERTYHNRQIVDEQLVSFL